MLLALLTVIAAGLGWIVRGSRCAREKRAVNAGWQHQVDAQQSENDRLQDQNKGLMQQVNQHQASRRDASNRSRELAESLREAMDKRDELQRNVKELRAELAHAVAQRDTLRTDIDNLDMRHTAVSRALREKDDRIERLKREIANWHSRVPPLVERYRSRHAQAQALEAELEAAHARIDELSRPASSNDTRIEPMDRAPADLRASNDQYEETSHHDMSAFDDQPRPESFDSHAGGYTRFTNGAAGARDDLQRIKGIGPAIESLLNELGYLRFQQIAELNEYDVSRIAERLRGFSSRIHREDWIGQARVLQFEKNHRED
ncbi:MAG TPA: hypothetical protein VFE85_08640 [Woeseiaceae bacterium]|nr:hypothetical protein [Woeseiaceae bacterium]